MMTPTTPATRHPHALTIALLIVAERQQRRYHHCTFEHEVYEVLDKAADLAGYSENFRADLYSRIVESALPADTMIALEGKVNAALWAAERTL